MPTIIHLEETPILRAGAGWQEIGLTAPDTFAEPTLIARRWVLEAGVRGPRLEHGDAEQLLYVIRGDGVAVVDGEELPLADESVLWLESGEAYCLVAGDAGLEILQGYEVLSTFFVSTKSEGVAGG